MSARKANPPLNSLTRKKIGAIITGASTRVRAINESDMLFTLRSKNVNTMLHLFEIAPAGDGRMIIRNPVSRGYHEGNSEIAKVHFVWLQGTGSA